MRLLTYTELTGYSKPQLWHLLRETLASMSDLPESCGARATAMLNIQHIRLFLARRDYTPC